MHGQGVVAGFGTGKRQTAEGHRGRRGDILVVVSARGRATEADNVTVVGLAVARSAGTCALKTRQCRCAADCCGDGGVVDLAGRHCQAAHGERLGGDSAVGTAERATSRQVVVGCIGAAQGERVDSEALVAAAHALGAEVAIARDADHVVGFQPGQAQADVVHGGGAVIDFCEARGGGRQPFLVDGECAHHHQVVAEVVAGFGDVAGTDAVATHFERAVGAGLRRHWAERKDSGTAGAVTVGVGIARGRGCGQGLDVVAAIQVLCAADAVARCCAVGKGCVVHGDEQPVCRHDGVGARRIADAVVTVVGGSSRGRERVGVSAGQGVDSTGVAIRPAAAAGDGKAA